MNKYRLSIKARLLLWLLSALFIVSTIFILATYGIERIKLRDLHNERLRQIAADIPAKFNKADLQKIDLKSFRLQNNFILQIWSSDAHPIYQSDGKFTLPLFPEAGFHTVEWYGGRWVSYIRYTDTHIIQVSQSLDARKKISEQHALHAVLPLILFIPLMAFLIPLCVNRGLRSLTQLSREVESRNSNVLGPLSLDDPSPEIAPLMRALNSLFHRLDNALDLQRQFIADASHELRTPLATLQIQTHLVEQSLGTTEAHLALDDLKAGIKRTGHLVEQLLTTSRLESSGARDAHQLLCLNQIARDVTIGLLTFANSKKIDLGMERMDTGAIAGSEHLIKLLIRNLIDNAIRYTPVSGQVDVGIVRVADRMHLTVEDSGPGISAEHKDRVFDRFYRCLGHDTPGSGLGLAIVKQVAVQHEAEIRLDKSHRLSGLKVTVSFKALSV